MVAGDQGSADDDRRQHRTGVVIDIYGAAGIPKHELTPEFAAKAQQASNPSW